MIYHCLIIGAGQSGLACARIAQDLGLSYIVLEQGSQAGEAWRQRSPELELFTPRSLSVLCGLELKGDSDAVPNAAEMAEYFESYRSKFAINCRFNMRVIATHRCNDGYWIVSCDNGERFCSYSIVLANGSNQKNTVPELSLGLCPAVTQVNAESYWKTPPQIHDSCLVVGDGASGRQIAHDLARNGYQVTLSGGGRNLLPNRLMSRNILYWLNAIGVLSADRNSLIAKLLRKQNPIPRQETLNNKALKRIGVALSGKVIATTLDGVCFDDETQASFSYVVWSMGYQEATDFLPLDFKPNEQWMTLGRGVLPLTGVFVVGRRWLNNRASELIMGAEHDARCTMDKLRQWLKTETNQVQIKGGEPTQARSKIQQTQEIGPMAYADNER